MWPADIEKDFPEEISLPRNMKPFQGNGPLMK